MLSFDPNAQHYPMPQMTQPNAPKVSYLTAKLARLTSEEIISLNKKALVTLLFIYTDGGLEFSNEVIKQHPSLQEQNRFVHSTVGDYMVLDLLKFYGYLDGESNRNSRWHKVFLTEKGLSKAIQLHSNFIDNNYEALF
jgi:hypothetical protein